MSEQDTYLPCHAEVSKPVVVLGRMEHRIMLNGARYLARRCWRFGHRYPAESDSGVALCIYRRVIDVWKKT